jgi:hypothetical protein
MNVGKDVWQTDNGDAMQDFKSQAECLLSKKPCGYAR